MSILPNDWRALKESADRARLEAAHAEANALYTQALAQPDLPWEAFSSMILARAECRKQLGKTEEAYADLVTLADRTGEELKQSASRLDQREVELTVINKVQDGLVKQLNFQAIIDLVGDT
ncbi:MAG TPA: hypothetical protein VF806_06170, partial [Anaerolineaceae bacterium]